MSSRQKAFSVPGPLDIMPLPLALQVRTDGVRSLAIDMLLEQKLWGALHHQLTLFIQLWSMNVEFDCLYLAASKEIFVLQHVNLSRVDSNSNQ